MSLAIERPEFAPPQQRGTLRALVLALIAHALLIAALTWGVRWKREGDDDAIEAEIWSSTPQQAAQRSAVAPPPPPAVPTPPRPAPPPPPPETPRTPPAPPPPKDPDIALERERRQRERQEQQRQQAEKAAQDKREREAREREQERKEQQQREKLAEQRKREPAEKAAQEKATQQKAAQQKAATAAEKARQDNIKRMLGQANGSASGTAEHNSGPRSGRGAGGGGVSSGYLGRVAALIKRNVVFDPTAVSANPAVEIQIQTSPDGTIVGTPRIVKSSGNASWDEAAVRAIQRTEIMPRDTDGRVPTPFPSIVMRPKDF